MYLAVAAQAPALSVWDNFFVIIGSAAATLTGLMFVVVTLLPRIRAQQTTDGVNAFSTPNVVHFGMALFLAAALSAPWGALWLVSLLLGLSGLGGVAYVALVTRRALRQSSYEPVLEDWLWHELFPFLSYATLVVMSIIFLSHPVSALFGVGASLASLLFIGIHNAWDNLTYLAITYPQEQRTQKNTQDNQEGL